MVLEWVTESADHHGLRYSSVNVGLDATNSLALSNFVFPVKNYGTSGFCSEIQGKFELTEPIGWNVAETVDLPGGAVNGNFDVEIFRGFPNRYMDTKFFRMECKLSQLPHDGVK
jgi:hypothetical protein